MHGDGGSNGGDDSGGWWEGGKSASGVKWWSEIGMLMGDVGCRR